MVYISIISIQIFTLSQAIKYAMHSAAISVYKFSTLPTLAFSFAYLVKVSI